MKTRKLTALFVASGLVLGVPLALLGGEIDISRWQYKAAIEIADTSDKHVVACKLPPEVLNLAQPDLRDLRIIRNDSKETGYVVRSSKGWIRTEAYSGKMYNLTYVPGRETSVTVDFGAKQVKNAVRVEAEGTNFRRRVRVEGSDDGSNWRVVRAEGFLFRAARDGRRGALEKDTVEIPDNDQRYLRITVANDTDDADKVLIRKVTSWREIHIPAETASIKVAATAVTQKKKTEIILDLGFQNVLLESVLLNVTDENFLRNCQIQGRNSETRLMRVMAQDSPKLEKTVPVPWNQVTSGTVFRFTTRSGVEESVSLKLHGAKYRYLRVSIGNGDDPPLQFKGASVTGLVQNLLLEARPGTRYSLYFGNSRALKPQYDLASYIEKLKRDGIIQARLGEVVPNPLHKIPVATIPWSERHKVVLWLSLIAMLAVLGLLVFRIARSARHAPNGS